MNHTDEPPTSSHDTPASEVSPVTGAQHVLHRGDSSAVVTEVGACLRVYRVGERDVIVPVGADDMVPGVHGGVLVPWPNRIGDGAYSVDGRPFQLDLSEPERRNAIHGLARHDRWALLARSDDAVELGLDLVPRPGYPFPLRISIRYVLTEAGLGVELTTTNLGSAAAPFGAGFHPWLSPGTHRIDDCTLTVGARGWVEVDDRLLPVAVHDTIPADRDFTSPRRLDSTRLDDGYLRAAAGSAIRLTDPDGVTAWVRAEEGLGWWQVYTGDGLPGSWLRSGVAAEPMTCPADAFRSGRDLVMLAPGDTHRCRFTLGLEA